MGSFRNDFVDNGDGTILDRATGLMWQKSGSSRTKNWKRGRMYLKQLNEDRFAGYSDWRIPTIEELASLVEREKINGVHINPIFHNKQKTCWSADTKRVRTTRDSHFGEYESWVVKFAEGRITMKQWSGYKETIAFYPNMAAEYYIRAVRSSTD